MPFLKGHPYVRLAKQPTFRTFWLAQMVSLFGDRLNQVALAVLVYNTTQSAFLVATILAASLIPSLILGPVAGVWVDRWPRKRILVGADILRFGLVLTMPFALGFHIILVIALVLAVGAATVLFLPAKTAAVTGLVPPEHLDAANAATWTADTLADVLGYPVAGLIVIFLGPMIMFALVIDALSYLVSAILLARLSFASPLSRTEASVRQDLWEGLSFLLHDRPLLENLSLNMIACLMVGALNALLVVYAHNLSSWLISYPGSYSSLQTAIGLGALLGSILTGSLRRASGPRILIAMAAMGAAGCALSLAPNILIAALSIFMLGLFNLLWFVPSQTLLLLRTPAHLVGRVIAVRRTLAIAVETLAMFGAGLAAQNIPAATVIGATSLLVVVAALLGFSRPALRNPHMAAGSSSLKKDGSENL